MDYDIIRSRRKTMSLTVDRNGRIIVRAPFTLSEEKIESFVRSRAGWLAKHSEAAFERSREKLSRLVSPPDSLPLLGEMCPVTHSEPYGYTDGCFHLPEEASLEELLPFLRKTYAGLAKDTLISRTMLLADRMGVKIAAVKINSAKTRWGSCSSKGVINLSWKLIAADLRLIDYVIVHELCHTEHMDHSPAFWERVQSVMPDYPERRDALGDVQKLLFEYGLD